MNTRMISIAALALALGGCSTVRGYMADRELESANSYCELKRANPAIKPIAGKLPVVRLEEINPEMLAIDAVPSDAEVEAIKALARDQRECRVKMRAVVKAYWPTQMTVREQVDFEVDLITAQLIRKSISFGNANRAYQEAALEITAKMTEEAKVEMAQAQEREAAAWRSIAQGVAAVTRANQPKTSSPQACDWTDTRTDCRVH